MVGMTRCRYGTVILGIVYGLRFIKHLPEAIYVPVIRDILISGPCERLVFSECDNLLLRIPTLYLIREINSISEGLFLKKQTEKTMSIITVMFIRIQCRLYFNLG
jgi:hypothetical protein